MKRRRVLNFQVALYTILFMCSSLSQSINVNSKHVVHNNKKTANLNNRLAPLPEVGLITDDEDEDDDDKSDDEYSNENEFGSSGLDIANPDSADLDRIQDNNIPFFLTEPEDDFIIKKRPANLTCKTIHAFVVS